MVGTFTGRQMEAVEVIPMELREVQETARTRLAVEAQRQPEVPLALLAQLQVPLAQVLQYVECLEVAEAEVGMVAEQASRPVAEAAPVTIQALWNPTVCAALTATAMQKSFTRKLRVRVPPERQLPLQLFHHPWHLPATPRIAQP